MVWVWGGPLGWMRGEEIEIDNSYGYRVFKILGGGQLSVKSPHWIKKCRSKPEPLVFVKGQNWIELEGDF